MLSVATSLVNTMSQSEQRRLGRARHVKRRTSSRIPFSRLKQESRPHLQPSAKILLPVNVRIKYKRPDNEEARTHPSFDDAVAQGIYGSITRQLTVYYRATLRRFGDSIILSDPTLNIAPTPR